MFTLVVFTLVTGTVPRRLIRPPAVDVERYGGGFDVARAPPPLRRDRRPARRALPPSRPSTPPTSPPSPQQSYLPVEARQVGAGRPFETYPVARARRAPSSSARRSASARWRVATRGAAKSGGPAERPGAGGGRRVVAPRRRQLELRGAAAGLPAVSGFYVEDAASTRAGGGPPTPAPAERRDLTVIGVLTDAAPLEMSGMSTSQRTLSAAFPGARARRRSTTCRPRPASIPTRLRRRRAAFLSRGDGGGVDQADPRRRHRPPS